MSTLNQKNLFLERRTFIKGMAATGLLSAFNTEQLFAQTVAPLRFVFIPVQHGWGTGPGALGNVTGSEYAPVLPGLWRPFDEIKKQCLFIDGLRGTWWGNPHDNSYTDILTASCLANAPGNMAKYAGPFPDPTAQSIDNLLAVNSGKPALRFSAGFANWGATYTPMSFDKQLNNLPYYTTADKAYQALFANAAPPSPTVDPVIAQLFPYLSAETQKIIELVPAGEKYKLTSYLDSVSKLEASVRGSGGTMVAGAKVRSIPLVGANLSTDIDSYFDMVRVAFVNDTHRVAVVGFGEDNNVFPWIGENNQAMVGHSVVDRGAFHDNISHFPGKPNLNHLCYIAWQAAYARKVVDFVKVLQGITDVDGKPMIDNTIFVLTGEIGHGDHDRSRKPHIVIGGGTRIKRGDQGRWMNIPSVAGSQLMGRDRDNKVVNWDGGNASQFSHADLFVKLANLAGSPISTFGIDVLNKGPLAIG